MPIVWETKENIVSLLPVEHARRVVKVNVQRSTVKTKCADNNFIFPENRAWHFTPFHSIRKQFNLYGMSTPVFLRIVRHIIEKKSSADL